MSYELREHLINEGAIKKLEIKKHVDNIVKKPHKAMMVYYMDEFDKFLTIMEDQDDSIKEKFIKAVNTAFNVNYKQLRDMTLGSPYRISARLINTIKGAAKEGAPTVSAMFAVHFVESMIKMYELIPNEVLLLQVTHGLEIIAAILALHFITGKIYRSWKAEVKKNHFDDPEIKKAALATI